MDTVQHNTLTQLTNGPPLQKAHTTCEGHRDSSQRLRLWQCRGAGLFHPGTKSPVSPLIHSGNSLACQC